MGAKRKKSREKEEEVLLTFLKQTKEGRYARVERSSVPFSRIKEQREETFCEEEYYYSIT